MFVAPVYAMLMTVCVFSLYGASVFAAAFLTFRLLSHPMFAPEFLNGGGVTHQGAIGAFFKLEPPTPANV